MIAKGHGNIHHEVAAPGRNGGLDFLHQRARLGARHARVLPSKLLGDRIRKTDCGDTRRAKCTLDATLVDDDADDLS